MKKKVICVLCSAVVAIGALGGCSGKSSPKKVDSKQTAETSAQTEGDNSEKAKTQTFKIGDEVEIGDFKVVLNNARIEDMSKDSYFQSEKPDTDVAHIDMTIENISSEQKTISSIMMMKVVDKDGRQLTWTVFGNNNGQAEGEVAPGRKITGEYSVEIPRGAKIEDYEFEFMSDLTSDMAVFQLKK